MSVGGISGGAPLRDAAAGAASAAAPAPVAGGAAAPPADAALRSAFPQGLAAELRSGARGPQVVAVQYALGRLGYLTALADGLYGAKTAAAVSAFQREARLPETGTVDARTLGALDRALASYQPEPPAARAANPLAYLSDWAGLPGLSKIEIRDRSRPIDWSHPEIQAAYGKFVGEYWEVMKANRVEADCKTLALFFMDQFRAKVKADTGAALPLPSSREGRIPPGQWTAATAARPLGFFDRFSKLPKVRPGYSAAQEIQKLDPKQSMIFGVNLRRAGVDANAVARAARTVTPWDPARNNGGDETRAEVPLQDMKPGDIVFIDHTGDGKFDHTVNVVGVERDGGGRVTRLKLAVGSFDDMKDADGATAPRGLHEVNNYAEEVTVDVGPDGRIAGSAVTWSSEPSYLVAPRYSARTTLMELRPGGRLKVARWG
jgi:peptidoglycan hydrolase-like protein with peptidoglycan-binding domain